MEELHISPSLDFERLVCNDYENFIYTVENMSKLKDMRNDLKAQVEDAKQQIVEKTAELQALWNYLDESEDYCQAFLLKHPGHTVTTISAVSCILIFIENPNGYGKLIWNCFLNAKNYHFQFNAEIKRCKDKRCENIGKYILKVREELELLWDLCQFSESQRSFLPFYSQTYTEDLLTLHELEAEKLRKFYKSNKYVFPFQIIVKFIFKSRCENNYFNLQKNIRSFRGARESLGENEGTGSESQRSGSFS